MTTAEQTHARLIFRCFDRDSDGALKCTELEHFYLWSVSFKEGVALRNFDALAASSGGASLCGLVPRNTEGDIAEASFVQFITADAGDLKRQLGQDTVLRFLDSVFAKMPRLADRVRVQGDTGTGATALAAARVFSAECLRLAARTPPDTESLITSNVY